MRFLAAGMTNAEIAERLVLSEHTVHRHVANILVKLGARSRAAAAVTAAERGLLSTERVVRPRRLRAAIRSGAFAAASGIPGG